MSATTSWVLYHNSLLASVSPLNAEETIFIDDRHDNVEVAAELGITPFHFDRRNPEQACADLRKVIYGL